MDQAVKYIEDLQDDFDFRYKTLQSRGEPCYKTCEKQCYFLPSCKNTAQQHTRKCSKLYICGLMCVCVCVSDSTDRNSEMMKQEVTRLQEMLNRLDFKRKVCICIIVGSSDI